jgi:membrane protein
VIYGSLALVPLFLVWLYLTWMIVMLAAEATFVHQNYRALIKSRVFGDMDAHKKMLLALQIYLFIAKRFHDAEEAPGADEAAERTAVPVETAEEILDAFAANGLLKIVEEPEGGYVPARSPGGLPARELVHAVFRAQSGDETFRRLDISDEVAAQMLDQFEMGGYNAVGDIDLESLFRTSGSIGAR